MCVCVCARVRVCVCVCVYATQLVITQSYDNMTSHMTSCMTCVDAHALWTKTAEVTKIKPVLEDLKPLKEMKVTEEAEAPLVVKRTDTQLKNEKRCKCRMTCENCANCFDIPTTGVSVDVVRMSSAGIKVRAVTNVMKGRW